MSPSAPGDQPGRRGGQAGRGRARRLGTVSIRHRVIAAVMAVLAVVLLVLSFSVQSVFAAQSDRNLDALLTGRAQLARQLARNGVRPQQVVNRVAVDGVVASLELRDGTVLGNTLPVGAGVSTVTTRLVGPGRVDGAELTLSVNSSLASGARRSLGRILLVSALVALGASAVLVALAVRLALSPLDAMAGLAQDVVAGSRGGRLSPQRTDTEIGRTAQAFDEMLDELEGAEALARRAEAQAVRAEGRTRTFLADAAHELRTPLAGIRAAAEALLQHGASVTPAEREHLEALLAGEAARAGRLVDDLLAVARLDAGVPSGAGSAAVDLGRLVEEEASRTRLLAPGLRVTVGGPPLTAVGEADGLRGVLRNLLDNARRAAGPDGEVRLTTAEQGDWAVLHVRDDGPGVPPADRERVFDRLVRLDAARSADTGGSGLGLAIARATARAHGGDLVCLGVPPPAHGADFRLTLPLRGPDCRWESTRAT